MNRYIVVNATALDRSGALSILCQFIENIPVDNKKWLVFMSDSINIICEKTNVKLVPISGVKPMYKRLWWDAFGLKKWLQQNDVHPIAALSLQNTGFNVGKKVPQYIYYHQSIPFYPYNWNPLKKQQRTFWFYKNIYPFFVKLFLRRDTKIFVQLDFIKDGFAKRFKHPKDNIIVCHPTASIPRSIVDQNNVSEKLILCYPAMNHFYKNHRVIEEAVNMVTREIKVLFTIEKEDRLDDAKIDRIGSQPYEKICEIYRNSDALVFPSYIETYGLPLIEAALIGLPILAADLPYAREVLAGYEGVTFIQHDNPRAWAFAIQNLEKGKRYKPLNISNRPSWEQLFKAITTY